MAANSRGTSACPSASVERPLACKSPEPADARKNPKTVAALRGSTNGCRLVAIFISTDPVYPVSVGKRLAANRRRTEPSRSPPSPCPRVGGSSAWMFSVTTGQLSVKASTDTADTGSVGSQEFSAFASSLQSSHHRRGVGGGETLTGELVPTLRHHAASCTRLRERRQFYRTYSLLSPRFHAIPMRA